MRLSNNTSALFEGIHLSVHVSACNNINMHTGVQKSETIENIENPSEEGFPQHQVYSSALRKLDHLYPQHDQA